MVKNKVLSEYPTELNEIINAVKVGIYITDGQGNTLALNNESERTGSMTKNEVLGKNMKELTSIGFIKESATLKALESGKEENIIQNLGDGGTVFVSAIPVYRHDRIDFVVSTERNITESMMLKELLEKSKRMTKKYITEVEYLRHHSIAKNGDVIANSDVMQLLVEKATRIAKHDATVLLTGESGTGKEIFANLIYKNSNRAGKPFIKVNCAAIPENLIESEFFGYERGAFTGADKEGKIGIFELANKGTLFLDEIGELSIRMQSKLLRALQEKEIQRIGACAPIPVDFRIIAATNVELIKAIENGDFREDLFYRLNIIPIEIPPLRKRKMDIKALASYFTDTFSREYKLQKFLSDEAVQVLTECDWPGNVRELKNVIERLVVSFDGTEITAFQVRNLLFAQSEGREALMIDESRSLTELMDRYEKEVLSYMLEKYKTAAAVCRKMKINKSTMCRKMKKYQLYDREQDEKSFQR